MRLRLASGLALASLAGAVAVMAGDGARSGGGPEVRALDSTVIVIEDDIPATPQPAWWQCRQAAAAAG